MPAYFLYGEPLQPPDERLVHVETISARSRLHDWMIEPHRHRDLHQMLLLQGGRLDARLDERECALRSPALLLVPPGTVHSFSFQPNSDGLVVSFAAALGRELAASTPVLTAFLEHAAAIELDRTAAHATDLDALGRMLLAEYGRSAPGRQAALRGLLGALLANVLRLAGDPTRAADSSGLAQRELVARFRGLLERRFREHASIASYAAALGVSEVRLRRACLAVSGESPLALAHLRLLVEAERQLRYTAMPITRIAWYLGFEDAAYFTRFFTRRTGVAPRAFRARAPVRG